MRTSDADTGSPADACPICETPLTAEVLERTGECRLYQCPGCEVQVWRPTRNPGATWYDESAHYLSKTIVDWLGWHHDFGMRSLPTGTKTLLDVGCADGRFVYAAAARGIDAIGIDFSPRLVRDGNLRYQGERLHCSTLEDHLSALDRRYDVTTLFEVVEHVEDPLALLKGAASATRPGGHVIVSTPNRFGRPRPPRALDSPPHHLTRWTPAALGSAAVRAGLTDVRITLCPPEVAIKALILSNVRLGIVAKLMRRRVVTGAAPPAHATGSVHRDIRALIRAKDVVAEWIARLASPLIGRWFPGPAMVMVARRPDDGR